MPALLDPRYERFCQGRMLGKTIDQAYIYAGFSANRGNATRLNANESVQARIRELSEQRAKKYEISAERTRQELGYLGYGNMKDIVDEQGQIRWQDLGREEVAAIKEITTDTVKLKDGMVVLRTKVKLADKHGPLKTLAQIDGLLAIEGPPPQSVVFIVERSGDKGRLIEHDDG